MKKILTTIALACSLFATSSVAFAQLKNAGQDAATKLAPAGHETEQTSARRDFVTKGSATCEFPCCCPWFLSVSPAASTSTNTRPPDRPPPSSHRHRRRPRPTSHQRRRPAAQRSSARRDCYALEGLCGTAGCKPGRFVRGWQRGSSSRGLPRGVEAAIDCARAAR